VDRAGIEAAERKRYCYAKQRDITHHPSYRTPPHMADLLSWRHGYSICAMSDAKLASLRHWVIA